MPDLPLTGASMAAQRFKKNPPLNAGDMGSIPGWERSPEKGNGNAGTLIPVFLPGKSHGQRSLVGYSPWGHRESNMT